MKIQVFSQNFSIYSFLYGIYSYCVLHLPLRERKKTAPASCYGNRGGSYTLLVLSQALTQLLAGVLDGSLSGCQNYRALGITYTDLYSFLWLRIIVHSSVALATLLFHQDPDTLFSHLYCTDPAYP